MAKRIKLPFVGSFSHVQGFGANPANYARFGIQGHDGDDWLMPEGTPLYAPVSGVVTRSRYDASGYGNYVYILDQDQGLLVNVAHMSRVVALEVNHVNQGDLIGYSGNTGNSSAPHVHVAAADSDNLGNRQNTNNGYNGWYSVMDQGKISIDLWPAGFSGNASGNASGESGSSTTGGSSGTTPVANFDTIFSKYYPGWSRTAAEQDFYRTYGGDEQRLRVARGLADEGKKKTTKARPAALKKKYPINPHFQGLSLSQISNSGIDLGRLDVLTGFLGIDKDFKFPAGYEISLDGFPTDYYPDSSEWLGLQILTKQGQVGKAGNYYIKTQYAGMNLHDIRNLTELPFRSDVLASYLGISDQMVVYADEGYGTQGFPNFNDAGSGEVQGFKALFTTTKPIQAVPTDIPEEAPDEELPTVPVIPKEPTIFVKSIPTGAKIYIDGLYLHDLTPSNKPEKTWKGIHTVRVEKTGYIPIELDVQVGESEQKIIEFQLHERTSSTPIESKPSSTVQEIEVKALIPRIENIERILSEHGWL